MASSDLSFISRVYRPPDLALARRLPKCSLTARYFSQPRLQRLERTLLDSPNHIRRLVHYYRDLGGTVAFQESQGDDLLLIRGQLLQRGVNHQQDWIRACKGGAPACSEFEVAAPYTEWLVLGSAAVRAGGRLLYDAKTGLFTNSPEANTHLQLGYRKGWEVRV